MRGPRPASRTGQGNPEKGQCFPGDPCDLGPDRARQSGHDPCSEPCQYLFCRAPRGGRHRGERRTMQITRTTIGIVALVSLAGGAAGALIATRAGRTEAASEQAAPLATDPVVQESEEVVAPPPAAPAPAPAAGLRASASPTPA